MRMYMISLDITFDFDERKCQEKIKKKNIYKKISLFACEMFYLNFPSLSMELQI